MKVLEVARQKALGQLERKDDGDAVRADDQRADQARLARHVASVDLGLSAFWTGNIKTQ